MQTLAEPKLLVLTPEESELVGDDESKLLEYVREAYLKERDRPLAEALGSVEAALEDIREGCDRLSYLLSEIEKTMFILPDTLSDLFPSWLGIEIIGEREFQQRYQEGERQFAKKRLYNITINAAEFLNIDWQGSDLRYFGRLPDNLAGINLRRANLCGQDLSGRDLRHANLTGANLAGANLSQARLVKVNLHRANLIGAQLEKTNLNGANLSQAELEKTNFSGANLQQANLSWVNLRNSNLIYTKLNWANLTGADLSGSDLAYSQLKGTALAAARLPVGFKMVYY
jgi:uncharacterized protein YjbI with pentapeptide repeats